MQHLTPDDVEYSRRPVTVNEFRVRCIIGLLNEKHPDFYQAWCNLLMLRCEQAHPLDVFANIRMRDFAGHIQKCAEAMNYSMESDATIDTLNAQWRYDFRERPQRNDPKEFHLHMSEM